MSEPEPVTLSLLRRWHAGESQALSALLARHLPAIRERVERRMGALLRSRGDADDYIQDVMMRLLAEGPRFEVADDEHFRMLLARIVENTLRDKHRWFVARRRAAGRERPLPDTTILRIGPKPARSETPSRLFDRQEKEAWIRLALDLLDEEPRELIVLREWEGLQFAEIAKRLGGTEDAARMRYQRAVAKLALKLGELRRGRIESACDGAA